MSQSVLFVINPIAGGGNLDIEEDIRACCSQTNFLPHYYETTGKGDLLKIKDRIRKTKPSAVFACGGDGTVNMVGRLLAGKEQPLGILPSGSANGLAAELGITTDLERSLRAFNNRQVLNIDILRINREHLCFHLADVGANALLIREFEKGSGRGQLGYFVGFLKRIFKRVVTTAEIRFQDQSISRRIEMIVFANATRFGTGAVINPEGEINDGRFELCIFRPFPRRHIPALALDFFRGTINHSKYVEIIPATQASVGLARPLPIQVDGELLPAAREIKVELHPQKLKVIVPRSESASLF